MIHPDRGALGAFLARLLLRSDLSKAEQDAILGLPHRIVQAPARRDLVRPGQRVDHAILVVDGFVGRFDLMRNGARQVTALYLKGDMCDLLSVVAPMPGWGITPLSDATVAHVSHADLKALAVAYPDIAFAFWRDTTADAAITSKWVGNIGRKNARARIAHLLCEIGLRAERADLGDRDDYPLPLTQEQIGDVTGLTGVHVNRSLQWLREEALVTVDARRVRVVDWNALAALAEFTPAYLLCDEPKERVE